MAKSRRIRTRARRSKRCCGRHRYCPAVYVQDVMAISPLRLSPEASLQEAARLLAMSEASDLMVAGDDGTLIGVISEGDLLRAVLPDMDEILAAGGSVEEAARALVEKGRSLASRGIGPLVITEPLVVSPTDHVAVAATLLVERQIRRLPVVDGGRLVGTISRSDVARALVATADDTR